MQGDRFRHTAQFRRWRTDKRPRDCTYDQLEVVPPQELAEIFATLSLAAVLVMGSLRTDCAASVASTKVLHGHSFAFMIVVHGYPRGPSRGSVPTEGGCDDATLPLCTLLAFCGTSSMVAACSKPSEPIEPIEPPESIAVQKLAGDEQTDTVLATLPTPLRVRVVRSSNTPTGFRVIWRPEGQPAVLTRADAGELRHSHGRFSTRAVPINRSRSTQ